MCCIWHRVATVHCDSKRKSKREREREREHEDLFLPATLKKKAFQANYRAEEKPPNFF
jgi:hypothetical protein